MPHTRWLFFCGQRAQLPGWSAVVNDDLSNEAEIGKKVRRRRSWYRRRLRMRRILVAVVFGTAMAGACWQNLARYFPLPAFSGSKGLPDSFRPADAVHRNLAWMAAQSANSAKSKKLLSPVPSVYPYSVLPGGVRNLSEFRHAVERDSVVRRHYARFDFDHAKLIRATAAREVYLSYRIRDTVFWTRKQVRLRAGELLLTDGKITARAHCGNQISDTAKPEVSDQEPAEDVLDQPVLAALDMPSLPMRPMPAAADLPVGGPAPPQLFGGGFIFPMVPSGIHVSGACPVGDTTANGRCNPKHRKAPVVPEPSTTLLAASGLALILWRYRRVTASIKA